MRPRLMPVLVLTALAVFLHAQGHCGYRDAFREMLLGRLPGARGEGLGRGGVAVTGDVAASAYNPAGLAEGSGLSFVISGSSDAEQFGGEDYLYIAGSLPIRDYGVVGLSRYRYDRGPSGTIHSPGRSRISSPEAIWLYTLTFASEPARRLYVGASLDLLRYRDGRTETGALYGDLGVTRVFAARLSRSTTHRLTLGGSISNITYAGIDAEGGEEELPVIFRLGSSYSLGWQDESSPKGLETLRFLVHAEYQDLLNSDLHNAVRVGAELTLLEILSLRLGRYWEEIDDYDQPDTYKDSIAETTFGWGVAIPAGSLTKDRLPLILSIDRTQIAEPKLTHQSRSSNEYRILTISLAWSF